MWAPIAILALHLYLETRARRWLVLFGAAWLLQTLSNGYALFFLSLFVGLWVLWFVVLRRQWQTAVSIALAMGLASVPLAPILSKYVAVHARNGFTRGPAEVRAFYREQLTAQGYEPLPDDEFVKGTERIALTVAPGVTERTVLLVQEVGTAALWRGVQR